MRSNSKIREKLFLIAFAFIPTVLFSPLAGAQDSTRVTLDSCYQWARANYPAIKQFRLIEQVRDFNVTNAARGLLPQLTINAQATLQSEVTKIPVDIPGVVPLSKDQYKIYGEVSQSLTNAYAVKQQRELAGAAAAVEEQRTEVELSKLKERVNQLYFGLLIIDAQLEQTGLTRKDIESALDRMRTLLANGTALPDNVYEMEAGLLNIDQRMVEISFNRSGYLDMMKLLTNRDWERPLRLLWPEAVSMGESITRAELKLFDFQKQIFQGQRNMVTARNIPQLNLFFQGGYGRPALNFLSNDFKFYYLGGLRLGWNISGFYTGSKEKQIQSLNQMSQDFQRETFLLNTRITMARQGREAAKYSELLKTDEQIIALHKKVKEAARAKLENGIITSADYLNYVNAEDKARINFKLHQIQLLQAQYNYSTTSGN